MDNDISDNLFDVRVILTCSGSQKRWGNYLGVPKHLLPIDGKPLLTTTTEKLIKSGFRDIVITTFNPAYKTEGTELVEPTYSILPDTGIGHSSEFWSKTGRTIVLFGDVYFSDYGIKTIKESDPVGIKWFGRYGPGKSGCDYGEMFGLSFPLCEQEKLKNLILFVKKEKEEKRIDRAGGWEIYRYTHGFGFDEHKVSTDFYEINDETDDFDYADEFVKWNRAFRNSENDGYFSSESEKQKEEIKNQKKEEERKESKKKVLDRIKLRFRKR